MALVIFSYFDSGDGVQVLNPIKVQPVQGYKICLNIKFIKNFNQIGKESECFVVQRGTGLHYVVDNQELEIF